MSTSFQIEWEWLANDRASVRSHGLTWSRLVIRGPNQAVTRVIDERTRSVRDGLFLPLMPLAEWLAANWWFLFEEAPPAGMRGFSPRLSPGEHRGWFQRHNLLAAREGYPLPDLTLASGDDDFATLSLRADERVFANAPVRFIENHQWLVPREELRAQLGGLLGAVVDRLDGCPDADVLALRALWQHRVAGSPEDLLLARRAAALGLDGDDPDAVDDPLTETLLAMGHDLPEPLLHEALTLGGDAAALRRRVEQLRSARRGDRSRQGDGLRRAREASCGAVDVLPYQQGWSLAQRFRERFLGVDARTHGDALDATIAERALLDEAPVSLDGSEGLLGWVDATAEGQARCVLAARGPRTAGRFLRARALGSALLGRRERLVTHAATRAQRIARAFATELLAPAEAVRAMLPRPWVDDDDMNEIARTLGVSPTVVRHQIENQRLATVAWS